MRFIATEVREYMAQLGFRTINEMVGRVDRVEMSKAVNHWKAGGVDLSQILYQPTAPDSVGRHRQIDQDHGMEKTLDKRVLLDLCKPALEKGEKVKATLPIKNVNRTVGAILGTELTRKHGPKGLPDDTMPSWSAIPRPAKSTHDPNASAAKKSASNTASTPSTATPKKRTSVR